MAAHAIVETTVPRDSALQALLQEAHFADAYRGDLQRAELSPAEIFQRAFRATPVWVSALLALRNRMVRLVGLKDVGRFDASPARHADDVGIGDRLGIFHVLGKTEREIVLGIDDRHLDVRVSVFKEGSVAGGRQVPAAPAAYVLSTVVRVHNRLGHLYMLPVGRIHPLVVRALMRRARL